ncbi:hypothetical protein VTK56DRAFT_4122 [Thermocarpiscus australiensis]
MEQNLNCNVQDCGSQISGRAVVTVCSHAICLRCANSHGFAGQAPYTCPVCRQPLNPSEVCEQLLHPSEEWKSVALSGLSPTVVMECAGRALSFWSYQMTNQISYQLRKNSKLKDYCADLQGEIESMWDQANQRITALTTKIRDMEREEHNLRRKCEDLRLTLENRTKELAQSQELYTKLKQRVLLSQSQDIPSGVWRSRTPAQAGALDAGHTQAHSQIPRPVMPVSARAGASTFFPTSPGYANTQPSSTSLVEWNKPAFSQRVPATPSSHLPIRDPRSLAFASTPRTGIGTTTSVPGSGRNHQQTSVPPAHGGDSLRGFSGTRMDVPNMTTPTGLGGLPLSRPSFRRTEPTQGISQMSPQTAERQASQHFELPRTILRRP